MTTTNGDADEPQEPLLVMQIDASLLASWQQTARGKAADILKRSPGEIHYYPSEADALSKSALTGLPGENPNTGINVAVKFSGRFAADIPK